MRTSAAAPSWCSAPGRCSAVPAVAGLRLGRSRGTSEPSTMPTMEKARPTSCGGTVASAATISAMPHDTRPKTTESIAPALSARFQ